MTKIYGHPRQYAMVAGVYVPDTKLLDDDEVRVLAGTYIEADPDAVVERHDSCPVCRVPSPCAVRRNVVRSTVVHRVKVTRRAGERE